LSLLMPGSHEVMSTTAPVAGGSNAQALKPRSHATVKTLRNSAVATGHFKLSKFAGREGGSH